MLPSNSSAPYERPDISPTQAESRPGPWPWYALLMAGLTLSGFFPWLMVAWAFYRRGRKGAAVLALLVNLALSVWVGWGLGTAKLAWWWLTGCAHLFNLTWAFAAWLVQRKICGPAAPRYDWRRCQSWITPLGAGLVIGVCVAAAFSIVPAFENRIALQQTIDSLDRETVLWDFFKNSFWGAGAGLLLGFWWAGASRRFRTPHVINFLAALLLTLPAWYLMGYLLDFLMHKGDLTGRGAFDFSAWSVVPPWTSGFRQFLLQLELLGILSLVVVPSF
ncbi:MAG: hypothetical protein JSW39_12045, partial [Desulfobacterales bacterium]